jgi:hypothetical protein
MSEQTFKSPGFFETEIDLSAPTKSSPPTPAGIIGTSQKGPAFTPVTVGSFKEFTDVFGQPDGKKYAPYAVQKFLEHRTAVTFVRVLGAGGGAKGAYEANAGFKLTGAATDDSDDSPLRQAGNIQFLIANHNASDNEVAGYPIFTDNDSVADSDNMKIVRAMIMVPDGARVLVRPAAGGPLTATSMLSGDDVTVGTGNFRLILSGVTGGDDDDLTGVKIFSASLDPASPLYLTNILNTSSDLFADDGHLLYADFPIEDEIAVASDDGADPGIFITSELDNAGAFVNKLGNFEQRYSGAKTTSFVSQPMGGNQVELFHFETLSHGSQMNEEFKITIANHKLSSDPDDTWATFAVQVRRFGDTDKSKQIIELFSGCNLNPSSPNYIAKKIGNKKVYFNFDTTEADRQLISSGAFTNKSNYIRVIMSGAVTQGEIPDTTLPFGFKGIPKPDISGLKYWDGSVNTAITSYFPPMPYRFKVTKGSIEPEATATYTGDPGINESIDSRLCWGLKHTIAGDLTAANYSATRNTLIRNFTKLLGTTLSTTIDNNDDFTLARVALAQIQTSDLGSVKDEMLSAVYVRNGALAVPTVKRTDKTSDIIVDDVGGEDRVTFSSLLTTGDVADFNRFSKYMKFTNIFYGASDGVNILNRDEAALNDKASSDAGAGLNTDGAANNTINSFRMASRILTNPMSSLVDIVAIPGMRDPLLTRYVTKLMKDYQMGLYVMDMPSFDEDGIRVFAGDALNPDTNATISAFIGLGFNSSYVATYYPDIKFPAQIVAADGSEFTSTIEAPSSIAALKAMAYTDVTGGPWFAPAGFNRASLDFVDGTSVRLNTADRDALYEAMINPIARFPNSGYVIFGQKTLQIAKTSLDRVNVRRMLLKVKREVGNIAKNFLFEMNNAKTRAKFIAQVMPKLAAIQNQQGIDKFSITMDSTNNTAIDVENNRMNGRIVLVPTRAIEYVAIDFIVTNSGVSFE